jgi:hypothetical protein
MRRDVPLMGHTRASKPVGAVSCRYIDIVEVNAGVAGHRLFAEMAVLQARPDGPG